MSTMPLPNATAPAGGPHEQPAADQNAKTVTKQLARGDLPPPETVDVTHDHVYCDGAGYGDGEVYHTCANIPVALGHPRVFLTIPPGQAFVDCTYCDRRFAMAG